MVKISLYRFLVKRDFLIIVYCNTNFFSERMKKITAFLVLLVFAISCSSGEETAKKNKDEETYVFDAIPAQEEQAPTVQQEQLDTLKPDVLPTEESLKKEENSELSGETEQEETAEQPLYFVQIGAFQTQEAAEQFINEAKEILHQEEFTITFSDKVNLFVVQLPPFKDRKEAEKVRNRLWRYDKFKDAFIVTEE